MIALVAGILTAGELYATSHSLISLMNPMRGFRIAELSDMLIG